MRHATIAVHGVAVRWLLPLGLLVAGLLYAGASPADTYLGIGFGIVHTNGTAYQVATSLHENIELHFTSWNGDDHSQGVGVSYRLRDGHGLSVALGVAYLGRISNNLLRHADAYIEIRWRFHERYSCEVGHYSTIGDDKGENFVLCGLHFDWSPLDFSG